MAKDAERYGYGGDGRWVLRAACFTEPNPVELQALVNDWLDEHRGVRDVSFRLAAASDSDSDGMVGCGWVLITYYEPAPAAPTEAGADG